jgi:hypothetical protein
MSGSFISTKAECALDCTIFSSSGLNAHQASQRTDAPLGGDVILGQLQLITVALEDFRVVA